MTTPARIFRLSGGKVASAPLFGPSMIPTTDDVLGVPGKVPPDTLAQIDTTMEWLAAEAARVAPWVTVYAVPEVWMKYQETYGYAKQCRDTRPAGDGMVWCRLGGLCRWEQDFIALSYGNPAIYLGEILHHELWHAISRRLPEAARKRVYEAVNSNALSFANSYADNEEERAARLYERHVGLWFNGSPARILTDPVELTLQDIYLGHYGEHIARELAA